MSGKPSLAKILYGTLFCVFIPALLVLWTILLDRNLSDLDFQLPDKSLFMVSIVGIIFVIAGSCFLSGGMYAIIKRGKGMPMNAYPPSEYVSTGIYAWVRHPIYAGFSLICFGAACISQLTTAIYIVAPIAIAGCFAIVYGYERDAINKHFGPREHRTLIGFFAGADRKLSRAEKTGAAITAFLPWIVIYEMNVLGGPSENWISTKTSVDAWTPIIRESAFAYAATYLFVGIVPFTINQSQQMRKFILDAVVAIMIAGFIFLVFPFYYEGKTVVGNDIGTAIIHFERSIDGTSGAFPSFHVIWALLAAIHLRGPGKYFRVLGWSIGIAISLSCFLTGIHSVLDVAGGAIVVLLAVNRNYIWNAMNKFSERLANSWKEWRFGPLRIINHSLLAGISAAVGVALLCQLIPDITSVIIIGAASLIGAGLWGQFIEGSAKMLRPFGYYGSIVGGMIGVLFAVTTTDLSIWQITASLALVAPVIQGIGRLRCFVQGCCHGKETQETTGIHVYHTSSRVCATGRLSGKNIHNTQLYSILFNIVIAGILWRMFYSQFPSAIITGMYFILAGLARFVEENYRGEPQTIVRSGLRIYQWAAIVSIGIGILISCIPSEQAPLFIPRMDFAVVATTIISGLIFAFAMGMDFPASTKRFSRLTG